MTQALQTHGKYVERWVPPATDRFCVYEHRDEMWARPLGIGTVERSLAPLYDVRDDRGELIGYCQSNPVDFSQRSWKPLRVGMLDADCSRGFTKAQTSHDAFTKDSICEIVLTVFSYVYQLQYFLCWGAQLKDAARLVETGFITCLGEDNKYRFAAELRRRAHEREFERCGHDRNVAIQPIRI